MCIKDVVEFCFVDGVVVVIIYVIFVDFVLLRVNVGVIVIIVVVFFYIVVLVFKLRFGIGYIVFWDYKFFCFVFICD